MDEQAVTRTVSVGLLLLLVLLLTGALAFLGGSFTDLASSESQKNIEITENETTISITLTGEIRGKHIYIESDSDSYMDGGIDNDSVTSVLGPSNGQQYLYSDGSGGVGTTVYVDISEAQETGGGEITITRVRDNAEEEIKTYRYSN